MTLNVQRPEGTESHTGFAVSRLAIREYEVGGSAPVRTIRIPMRVFSIAAALVPGRIREELAKEGFDLNSILHAAREIHTPETLVEVEDHRTGRRIVVALE